MSLSELSNELLVKILVCLESDSLKRDHNGNLHKWLLPLTTCSKHLSELATPRLYCTFLAKDPKTVKLFVKTIAANEELASMVRYVSAISGNYLIPRIREQFDEWICTENYQSFEFLGLNQTDLQTLFSKKQPAINFGVWAAQDLSFWALMALTLCLAPNLIGLYLRLPVFEEWEPGCELDRFCYFFDRIAAINETHSSYEVPLRNLLFVDFCGVDMERQLMDFDCMIKIIALPSLRKFACDNTFVDYVEDPINETDSETLEDLTLPKIPKLNSLILQWNWIPRRYLAALLSSCTNLRHFNFHVDMEFKKDVNAFIADTIKSLIHLNNRLEILGLRFTNWNPESYRGSDLSPLRDFKVLKLLYIDGSALIPSAGDHKDSEDKGSSKFLLANAIPSSLLYLGVDCSGLTNSELNVIIKQVQGLVIAKRRASSLKMVHLRYFLQTRDCGNHGDPSRCNVCGKFGYAALQHLSDMCQRNGIRFELGLFETHKGRRNSSCFDLGNNQSIELPQFWIL
ncbi:uncharacterized protein EAF01_008232 [Botrytis porri]|uniref:Uncharacterized protein n=1 Tax=Botrytis porri TaxID=87229 RepID=A0A4Z1L707_9HELO|nr:uncharacterized protein EAF01_008232 [Botrytis porri]KAF7899019.1 hypothetical protein EAF01_008232 [Botrytis porri]TGO92538.1 hypothetical protein BPOR_0001g00230 [Botrytis porri]